MSDIATAQDSIYNHFCNWLWVCCPWEEKKSCSSELDEDRIFDYITLQLKVFWNQRGVSPLVGNIGILRIWWSSHPHHVGRERLEAAGLWFAGERPLQDPSFEHVKKQTGIQVAVLTTNQTWSTRGRVTQLLYPYDTLLPLWQHWKGGGQGANDIRLFNISH